MEMKLIKRLEKSVQGMRGREGMKLENKDREKRPCRPWWEMGGDRERK